ncbi:leukocyte receptor cluster member 8 homolog isoform X2 [Ornithodoros turicata]|uniref:leukocyte receptor cluster member 8 homolog isoform X2 n=1 Tax=Ornithodoros turicata TaxID=34597 RepID=UPI0031389195
MAALQAYDSPCSTPWSNKTGASGDMDATPVDPNQAWENARKALEKVQTNKTTTVTEQGSGEGYNAQNGYAAGYGFWGAQQQQGAVYPGYMGYGGYGAAGQGGYGFYPPYNLYNNGYYAQMQYPQMGTGNGATVAPPPPPGDSGGGTEGSNRSGAGNDSDGMYYGGSAGGMNQYGSVDTSGYGGMHGVQAPGSGGIRFSLPKRGGRGGNKFGKRINSFQPRMAGGDQSASTQLGLNSAPRNDDRKISSVSQGSNNWPESLKDYVNRAFAKCKTDIDKDQVEIVLKGKLTKVYNDGSMWTKDWANEPLPSIHSERLEKEQQGTPVLGGNNSKPLIGKLPGSSPNKRLGLGFASSSMHASAAASAESEPEFISLKSRRSEGIWSRVGRRSSRSRSRSRTPPKDRRKKRSSLESSPSPEPVGRGGGKKSLSSSVSCGGSSSSGSRGKKNKSAAGNNGLSGLGKKAAKKAKKALAQFQAVDDPNACEKLQKRAARFELGSPTSGITGKKKRTPSIVLTINNNLTSNADAEYDWESFPVVGTCRDLEKQYLRLTSAPDPSTIRPVEVLRRSLEMVKQSWLEKQDYHYVCDQLKSIRQDLTVQCIRDSFTVLVYETHARIALEKGDHEEFNQCQTQLKMLYQEVPAGNPLEFTGYRILYSVFTRNTLDMKNILASLVPEEKADQVVSHALAICFAWSLGNYARFFKLYNTAPSMSGYILDWCVSRERKAALKAMLKAYRPVLPVEYIERVLGFASREDALAFLAELNVTFVDDDADQASVDCRESLAAVLAC